MKDPQEKEIIEHILQLSDKAFHELIPMLPTAWLQLDLTMPQLKVVLLLFLNGPSRMTEIASALDVSLATASGVADRLAERKIVLRESLPDDRRVVLCRLSENGEKMIGGLWHLARERTRELLEMVEPTKLVLVVEVLEALLKAGAVSREDFNLSKAAGG
ncbi:MarR family winged helix-turn-helix transcriptional regulator [Chloroflexota bacterium]